MKVLWFSVTPSRPTDKSIDGKGLSWIGSLQSIVKKSDEINLGISYLDHNRKDTSKEECDGITYYPMGISPSRWNRLMYRFSYKTIDALTIAQCKKVINDFNPDIIHIFGSEWCFGLVYKYTDIPIVVHIQGSIPPYLHTIHPSGMSLFESLKGHWYNPHKIWKYIVEPKMRKNRIEREEEILRNTKYFMGRTRWDYALTKLYSPQSKYYYCSEALRPTITHSVNTWKHQDRTQKKIVTVASHAGIKGYDVILKVARLLKQCTPLNFKWELVGISKAQLKFFEEKTKIYARDVNIVAVGAKNAESFLPTLLDADLFVNASYMDNSPNAICEAQYIGMPIVTTNCGGIPSLFSSEYPQDFLVPIDDPHFMAYKIWEVLSSVDTLEKMSILNMEIARKRHSEENILNDLLATYKSVIKANNSNEQVHNSNSNI